MQSLSWYIRRLRAMSPAEVAWRAKSSLRDATDRFFVGKRQRMLPLSDIRSGNGNGDQPGFSVTDMSVGAWETSSAGQQERQWLAALQAKADRIAAGRLSFFHLEDQHLGNPIDWNRDHETGKQCPMIFAPSIDYRDIDKAGDCKLVWEPSRHHQLVVLARAYRASGQIRYAQAVVDQITSWLDQCPFGVGMQWRSPMELGIRVLNWTWAIDLIRPAGLVVGEFRDRLINAIYRHVWDVARKFSQGSSSNNHVIGEAAGVYIAASYFRDLKGAARWRASSREALCREILAQTAGDGGDLEQATGYHLFVVQFLVLAGLVGRWTNDEFPREYWSRLEKMFEFMGALSEGGENLPMFGDADDGYVLDLGGDPRDVRRWLAAGAVLFDRADFKQWAGEFSEATRWLMGNEAPRQYDTLHDAEREDTIKSRAFPETGYYLLQAGRNTERISVVFDCGPLGFGSLAGHGHADALSFTLRAFGVDVLVDPGTYDYFTYPAWRQHLRSTPAHNTLTVDGQDQSVMQGLFLWGHRAEATRTDWQPHDSGGAVAGEHDGYHRLDDPATHRRRIELDGERRIVTITDEIDAKGQHDLALYFHLAEQCSLTPIGDNRFRVDAGRGIVEMELDPRLDASTIVGSEDPIGGWVSRGYHRKVASTTMAARCVSDGPTALITRITVAPPA